MPFKIETTPKYSTMSYDRLFENGNTIDRIPPREPEFEIDRFESSVFDELEKEWDVSIRVEHYTYDNSCHIAKCEVETKADFEYLNECIVECIEFRLGKTVHLQCEINYK